MKRLIFVLSILLFTACATGPRRGPDAAPGISKVPKVSSSAIKLYQGPFAINPEGAIRPAAKVYLPLQFAQRESWPLVVLLHGFSGTAEAEDTYLTLRYRTSMRGFILLTPDGTITPKKTFGADGADLGGNSFWNATDFCCDFANTKVDDTGYLTKLIEITRAKYNVDPNRIYLIGHSNGGFMANRLGCEIGDQLAGIAVLAGGSFARPEKCRDPKPVPYLQIHALDDPTIFYDGGFPQYAGGRATISQWLIKNQCSAKTGPTLQKDFLLLAEGNDTTLENWGDCASSKPVALWTIKAFENKHHSPHIPFFNFDFTGAVLDFLFANKRD